MYSILHVLGALYYFLKDNTSKGCTMGTKSFKSRIYKNFKNIFSNFLVVLTYAWAFYIVQLASIKNISWNYENMDSTSKQIWPQCGYLAGKAHASKRPKLQILQTTGTFPMIATWFLLAAKTSYYLNVLKVNAFNFVCNFVSWNFRLRHQRMLESLIICNFLLWLFSSNGSHFRQFHLEATFLSW